MSVLDSAKCITYEWLWWASFALSQRAGEDVMTSWQRAQSATRRFNAW